MDKILNTNINTCTLIPHQLALILVLKIILEFNYEFHRVKKVWKLEILIYQRCLSVFKSGTVQFPMPDLSIFTLKTYTLIYNTLITYIFSQNFILFVLRHYTNKQGKKLMLFFTE